MARRPLTVPLSVLIALACIVPATAALAPSTVERIKGKCSDVVEITITKVTVGKAVNKFSHSRTGISYVAEVTGVQRSKSGVKVGDTIEFESYFLKGTPPPGPRSPSLLEKGWNGSVFLNKTKDDNFKIGVYGHSFEEKKDN